MKTKEIAVKIQGAVADEQGTGRLGRLLEQTARKRGLKPTKEVIQSVVRFVQNYVEYAPLFMEQGAIVGGKMGLHAEMKYMLNELESYRFDRNDMIPDHLGLIGLMDDAYATLFLLQALSDYCQATFGRPLLQRNLTAENQSMRGLIGDSVASILEQRVGVTIGNAMMQRMAGQIANAGFAFPATPANHPIWGLASPEEIATVQLGAMGIF